MSLKFHVFWRTVTIGLIFLASICFLWGVYYEVFVWHKSLLGAFISSWWNWVGMVACIVGSAFASYLDDLVDEGEEKP